MVFQNYWNSVKKISSDIGALYILSKVILGIGIGIIIANSYNFNNITGILIAIIGILIMLPAEIKIIPYMKKR